MLESQSEKLFEVIRGSGISGRSAARMKPKKSLHLWPGSRGNPVFWANLVFGSQTSCFEVNPTFFRFFSVSEGQGIYICIYIYTYYTHVYTYVVRTYFQGVQPPTSRDSAVAAEVSS